MTGRTKIIAPLYVLMLIKRADSSRFRLATMRSGAMKKPVPCETLFPVSSYVLMIATARLIIEKRLLRGCWAWTDALPKINSELVMTILRRDLLATLLLPSD